MKPHSSRIVLGTLGLGATLALPVSAMVESTNYVGSYSLRSSYTAPSDFDDAPGTESEASLVGLRYVAAVRVSDTYRYEIGVDYERWGFSGSVANLRVPDQLQSVSLILGNRWQFADRWTLQLAIKPGLYSDFDEISGDDIHVPGLALFSYDLNPQWKLLFGVNVHAGREIPVLPAFGAVWRPDDTWTVNLVLPRADVTYRFDEQWSGFVGFELAGGAFTVGESFGTDQAAPELDGERLTYREIRFGAGARFNLGNRLRVELEGGWVADRRFVYDDLDRDLEGDGAPYLRVGLSGSY